MWLIIKFGVLDSGRGGLELLKKVKNQYSNIDFLLIMDEAYFPYGIKTEEELRNRVEKLFETFKNKGIETVLLACNTISSIYYDESYIKGISVNNVIKPVVKYVNQKHYKNIVVLATKYTINSGIYANKLNGNVIGIATDEYIRKIEERTFSETDALSILNNIPSDTDLIILGCTHYIAVKELFSNNSSIEILSQDKFRYIDVGKVSILRTVQ